MTENLYLACVPLRPEKLAGFARRRGLPVRDLDDGYLAHCLMRELWQEHAPSPFVLRDNGRTLDAWGYTNTNAQSLIDRARQNADSSLLDAVTHLGSVATKELPQFKKGKRVGFLLRACPVVRLAKPTNGHRAGAEVDAFLARCFAVGKDTPVSREDVYRDWLTRTLGNSKASGANLERIAVSGIARQRLIRRSHGQERKAFNIERPDVRFEGEIVIVEPDLFRAYLAHGVGRHRAFGFGALVLIPPQPTS